INPEIIEQEGAEICSEGCLSLPGESGYVERPARVKIRAQDRELNTFEMEGEGLLARAFCHEIDHLDGILYIDKIIPEDELEFIEEDEE
ncbi:MAG: peptide deformylase, partial [Firmicutes bacterium]|nr:peptide deformylase [Bacillota bacterium]